MCRKSRTSLPRSAADRIASFPPLLGPRPRVLVLGSMPGAASLAAGQYYAHPRNVFWRVLGELLGFDAASPYAERVAALQSSRVAVWDVLATCVRPGSLDIAIDPASIQPNDIGALLLTHGSIERVIFNGAKAEECFHRHVLPRAPCQDLILRRVPSTSPAHAGLPYARKLEAWRAALM